MTRQLCLSVRRLVALLDAVPTPDSGVVTDGQEDVPVLGQGCLPDGRVALGVDQLGEPDTEENVSPRQKSKVDISTVGSTRLLLRMCVYLRHWSKEVIYYLMCKSSKGNVRSVEYQKIRIWQEKNYHPARQAFGGNLDRSKFYEISTQK